jgi:hypothetical protein
MPRRRLTHALLAAVLAWALPLMASAQTTDVAGVKFDNEITLQGGKLLLNGAGIRTKFIIKVYAAGLYVPARLGTPEAAWDTRTPRILKVVMLREVDANDMGKLLTSGMEKNTSEEEFARAAPGTARLLALFAAKKKLAAGDSFAIEWAPGKGTVISINGKSEEPIAEPDFFASLMKIWLGKSPADDSLKDALLGKG